MFPPTVNHGDQTAFAVSAARSLVGVENVNDNMEPLMGSEDFAFMLIGNRDSAGLHDANFDFNDDAIPFDIAYFRKIVERRIPL
ncbi:M20/M25/M40 family metallo-hydrolase [Rhizobium sp. ZPR3]